MATRKPTTPTTTVKINHQHDYSMLTIKLASGDTLRYTTSWSGEKFSCSAKDEWLLSNVGMNATFKALQGMSLLAGENVAQRYERIKAVAEKATTPYGLVEALRAAETTPEQKRAARKHSFEKHCKNDGLPPEMFGAKGKINAKGKGPILATCDGYDERGGGKIRWVDDDGAAYLSDAQGALRAYVMANQQAPAPAPRDFSNVQVPAPTKATV